MKIISRLFIVILLAISPFSAFAQDVLAVNIALSVSDSLKKHILEMNQKIKNKNPNSFLFDSTHMPHVTILQMYIKAQDLKKLRLIVQELLIKSPELVIKGTELSGEGLVSLVFQKNSELELLQKTLVERTKNLKKKDGNKSSFFDPESMNDEFVEYVTSFENKHVGNSYTPHITLGVSKELVADDTLEKNQSIIFNEVLIAQLGHYGSARKVLSQLRFRN